MTFVPDDIMSLPSQLFDSERPFLKEMAWYTSMAFEKPTIVNIGIWMGASCHALRLGASGARLVGIDVMANHTLTHDAADFLNLELIQRNSNYVAWKDPIHLLFIDGGHEYQTVSKDIEIYASCVVSGGTVVFHDSGRNEVLQAINLHMRSPTGNEWEELTRKGADKVGSLAWFRRL